MWPAGWVSGCPEALEGDNQRTKNLWVSTALRHPQEIYKELRGDIEEGRREGKRMCLERSVQCERRVQLEPAGVFPRRR